VEIFSRKIRAAFHLNDEEKFLSSSEIINATEVVQKRSRWSKTETKRRKINQTEVARPLSRLLRPDGDFGLPARRDM
jgi:hypothetical protein